MAIATKILRHEGIRTVPRCQGITAAGEQCRCWAVERVNGIPYCKQHAQKELALARDETPEGSNER